MPKRILAWLATALAFTILDALWLTQIAPHLYRPALNEVLSDTVALAPAAVFYLLYVTGLVILAVRPAIAASSVRTALWRGAVLGLTAYGAYDLTNQATLKVWELRITMADMSWGAFASAMAAAAGYWAGRKRP